MKKLIISICTVALAATLLGSSTFAWFSMNRSVDATGMSVRAMSDSSLVISTANYPTADYNERIVDFEDESATKLYASTHDLSKTGDAYNYATGLKYVTNAENVDPKTGKVVKDETLTFAEASNDDKKFYKDYIVLIASNGQALDSYDIQIRISSDITGDSLKSINKAISADFYAMSVSDDVPVSSDFGLDNYVGKLNLANTALASGKTDDQVQSDYVKVSGTETVNGKEGFSKYKIVISDVDIPQIEDADGATNEAIAVLIRVYVDGALQDPESGNAYIRNKDVNYIQDIELTFSFEATPHVA